MKGRTEALVRLAREHALLIPEPDRMLFRLEGREALDLLHRISTNDILTGAPVRTVRTLFCTEKGRVIDVAEIVSTGKDLFMVLTASSTDRLLAWIEKFTITEDITISPLTTDSATYLLIGPEAIPTAQSLRLLETGRVPLPDFSAGRTESILAWRSTFGGIPCVRISAGRAAGLPKTLGEKVLSVFPEHAHDVYDVLRTISLVPETGHEIMDTYNPLEIGLLNEISFTKGCYIGQEVIARLDSYKKVQRKLCLLSAIETPLPEIGTAVQCQGADVGAVTTAVSTQARSLVLAVVRNEACEGHETLQISGRDFSIYRGTYPAYSLLDFVEGGME